MMFSTQHLLKERLADLHREGERQRLARSVARSARARRERASTALVIEAEGAGGASRGRVLGRSANGRTRVALDLVESSVRELTGSLHRAGLPGSRIVVRVEVDPRDA